MTRNSTVSLVLAVVIGGSVALAACDSDSPAENAPVLARQSGSTTLTVTGTSPDSAGRDTTLTVAVLGSGFDRGSAVAFGRSGTVDPQLHVNGVTFVSSQELAASLTVASDATLGSYDVMVTTSGGKKGVGSELFAIVLTDAAATWTIPLADGGLALRSDHLFGDGINSVYADGVCGVTATLHVSVSGDATVQTAAPTKKGCGRQFTLAYPDGVTETLPSFANLASIESAAGTISVGSTVRRHFNFAPGSLSRNPSRCGTLYFGPGRLGNGVGSDSLLVTRTDASTWHVYSDPVVYLDGLHDRALCGSNNQLYAMPVDITVRSSRPEP